MECVFVYIHTKNPYQNSLYRQAIYSNYRPAQSGAEKFLQRNFEVICVGNW